MINFKALIKKFPAIWPLYWNSKWKKNNVYYCIESGKKQTDVKKLLTASSPAIEETGMTLSRLYKTSDEIALAALRTVKKRQRYVKDSKKYGKPEKWQDAVETFNLKTGDCEDGAILIMKIMEAAGIPAWRRKICCGWVKTSSGKGGHAYVIYLADDFQWYVLDWCFHYGISKTSFNKTPHKDLDYYMGIWWTFNEKYSWAQHDTEVRPV